MDGYSKEYVTFFENLYQFYQSLPDSEKFQLIPIDIGCSYFEYFDALSQLLPDNIEPPNQISNTIDLIEYAKETLNKLIAPSDFDPWEIKTQINQDLIVYNDLYKNFLEANFESFNTIVKADSLSCNLPISQKDPFSNNNNFQKREIFLANELKKLLLNNPEQKIFGQFGRTHIKKIPYFNHD